MQGKGLSIYKFIVTTIFAVVLSVMAADVALLYVTVKDKIIADTQEQALSSLASLRDNILGFMEAYSINEYEKLVANEMGEESYAAIIVEDYHVAQVLGIDVYTSGRVRDKAWRSIEFDRKNPSHTSSLNRCFIKNATEIVSFTGEVMGKVTICSSDRLFTKELQKSVINQAITTVLTSLLLIAALYFALKRTLLTPLAGISDELLTSPGTVSTTEPPSLFGYQAREISTLINSIKIYQRELNEQQEELRNERNRFDLAVQGSQDGLWDWDTSTDTVYFSSQWKSMLGYENYEVGNGLEEWSSRVHPDDMEETLQKIDDHLKGKTDIYESRHRLKCKDGSWKWILDRGKALFDENGNPVRVVGFHTDITPQVRHEKEISKARQAAEKANQAKSEFLAAMSHELRTPLNAILGFSQLMQYDADHPLSEKQNEHVQNIITGGEHLLALVNEILDLARIEADHTSLVIEDVSIDAIIQDAVSLAQPLTKKRRISIENRYKPQAEDILRTDRKRAQQVLLNLLSNAAKYNRDGGTIRIHGYQTKTGFFRVAVTDTGVGIAEQDFSSVFEMFHRLHEDPHITRQGTGIGLTVSKLLIESMAGRIGFDSKVGVGSTFWFELPLASNENAVIPNDVTTGIDDIDKDHLSIVKLMNKISQGDFKKAELGDAISGLQAYTFNHFMREEAIMEACGFPELERHKNLHVQIRNQVMKLDRQWKENQDPTIIYALRDLLRHMWVNHVLKEDMKIASYAQSTKGESDEAPQDSQ